MYFAKNVLASLLTFSTNLSEVDTFVVKDFDAVSTVVWNKNLLAIVNHHSIGKFKVLGTSKLIEYIAGLVKNDHSHHFAFNNNDATFIINGDSARMLQDIGTKFAHKLTILVINLDLKKWKNFLYIFIKKRKEKIREIVDFGSPAFLHFLNTWNFSGPKIYVWVWKMATCKKKWRKPYFWVAFLEKSYFSPIAYQQPKVSISFTCLSDYQILI